MKIRDVKKMESTQEAIKNTFMTAGYFGEKKVQDMELISFRKAKLKREVEHCFQVKTPNLSSPYRVRGSRKDAVGGGNGNDTRACGMNFQLSQTKRVRSGFREALVNFFVSIRGCVNRSVASDSLTLWTVTRQAPLSMDFSRQGYWSG